MYTLEQLSSIEEIRDLRRRYSHYYDGQDIESLCKLFVENAVCQWDEKHGGCWNGIMEIRRNYLGFFEKFPGYFSVLHAVTNHIVQLTGEDTAWGRCFLLDYNFLKNERPIPLSIVGVYDDIYVKTTDGWKFQQVSLDFLWPEQVILNSPLGQ